MILNDSLSEVSLQGNNDNSNVGWMNKIGKKFKIFLTFQTAGADNVICCSVEEVEDDDNVKEEEKEDGEDYKESAKHITVIETDFKRPLRSSFRAKKGTEKR